MEYKVPPKPQDRKQRMQRVTDADEIAAIRLADLRAPIGIEYAGAWFAEEHSLRQFRNQPVEFEV